MKNTNAMYNSYGGINSLFLSLSLLASFVMWLNDSWEIIDWSTSESRDASHMVETRLPTVLV